MLDASLHEEKGKVFSSLEKASIYVIVTLFKVAARLQISGLGLQLFND